MRRLPLEHPGTADHRSPGRFLLWIAKGQWHTLLGGALFGILWMSSTLGLLVLVGVPLLFSAHDADRVAVVEDGRIAELGSHDELVAAGGSYAALWDSWNGKH